MAQGIWTPGGPFDRQPQGPVGVDWSNPIARNLSISVPLGGDTRNIVPGVSPQTASSGHKIAVSSIGLVSEFTGTTDGIVHTFTAPSSPITISAWIFASGVGGGAVCALTGPYGGDNWWTHTLEVSATQIFSNTAAGGGTDASINYALPAVGRWYHAALVVASATDRRLYVNGVLIGTSTVSRSFPAFAEARIGSIGGNWGGASKLVGLAADVNVWRRALVLPEIQFISGVQWPLLCDTSDALIFDMGAGGGAGSHTLTGANSTQSNTGTTASIAQAHALAGANSVQANTGGTGSIGSDITLAGAAGSSANTGSVGAIGQVHVLVGAASAQANGASTGTITQVHALAGANATQANVGSTAALGETVITLAGSAGSSANTGSVGAITQAHVLVGAASVQDNVAAASAIVQAHVLAGANAVQGNVGSVGAIAAFDFSTAASPYVAFVPYTNHIAFVPAVSNTALRGL